MKKIFSISNILISIYFVCICVIAVFAFRRPHYNWDMLAYMALVVKLQHNNISSDEVHEITYTNAKKNVPAPEYSYLLGGEYRKSMAENSTAFYNQLPFYIVKPLYIGLIYLFNKAGFSLPLSTALPSILSYLLIGVLLFYWLKKYLNAVLTFAISLLIMYSGFMVSIARESTPDCLSAFLLLTAFYFIIEKPSFRLMCFFLILSLFARLDNIITCGIIISFLFYCKKTTLLISFKQYALTLFMLVCCYLCITFLIRPFGWNMSFYDDFLSHLELLQGQNNTFSLSKYLSLAYSKIITSIVYHHITLFMIVIVFIVGYLPIVKFRELNFEQLFSLLLVFIILIRFIIFPDLSDRFNIANYIFAIILLVKKYAGANVISAKI